MQKTTKKALSMLLVMLMMLSIASIMPTVSAVSENFIVAVIQKTNVPNGYKGIYTAQDLNNIRNNLKSNYILMNDIDLSSWGNWTPIGNEENSFSGIFDGNGYLIKNMNINFSNSNYVGLFYSMGSGASIKNVGMSNVMIDVSLSSDNLNCIGSIVGCAASDVLIDNCYVTGNINVINSYYTVGGIAGEASIFSNCYNKAKINVNARIFESSGGIGGIVGQFSCDTIYNCYNEGDINVNHLNEWPGVSVGGILGQADFKFSSEIIKSCYNLGNITVLSVTSGVTAGGIAGSASNTSIQNCFNAGSINAKTNTENPYYSACAGGISGGVQYTNMANCYNIGEIKAECIYGDSLSGGIAAYAGYENGYTIQNCYYLDNIIKGIDDVENVIVTNVKSLTNAQMKQQSSFTGFDFNKVWEIKENSYPTLKSLPVSSTTKPNNTKIEFDYQSYTLKPNTATTIMLYITPDGFELNESTLTITCSDPTAITLNYYITAVSDGKYTIFIDISTTKKEGNYKITATTNSGGVITEETLELIVNQTFWGSIASFFKDVWNFIVFVADILFGWLPKF